MDYDDEEPLARWEAAFLPDWEWEAYEKEENKSQHCPFCGTENEPAHSECRNCGRPLSLKGEPEKKEKQQVLERLSELETRGVVETLVQMEGKDDFLLCSMVGQYC